MALVMAPAVQVAPAAAVLGVSKGRLVILVLPTLAVAVVVLAIHRLPPVALAAPVSSLSGMRGDKP